MKTKRVLKVLFLVFIIGIFIIAIKNFSTPYFSLNDHVYVRKSDDGNETIYYSKRAKKFIKISQKEGYKEINIEGKIYKVNVGNKKVMSNEGEISDRKLVTIAFESLQDKKGESQVFSVGVLFLIIGFIQLKFPTLLFYLKHSKWVKDPEPTDAYIEFSKMGGFILCVFGIGMMIYWGGIFKF